MAKKNVNLRIGWDLKAFSDSSQNLSREGGNQAPC